MRSTIAVDVKVSSTTNKKLALQRLLEREPLQTQPWFDTTILILSTLVSNVKMKKKKRPSIRKDIAHPHSINFRVTLERKQVLSQ